jgi:hypothetical protein
MFNSQPMASSKVSFGPSLSFLSWWQDTVKVKQLVQDLLSLLGLGWHCHADLNTSATHKASDGRYVQ